MKYAEHLTDIGNLWPYLRDAAARNDWTMVEIHAARMTDAASRVCAIAKAEGYAAELIRRAEAEKAARAAQLAALLPQEDE